MAPKSATLCAISARMAIFEGISAAGSTYPAGGMPQDLVVEVDILCVQPLYIGAITDSTISRAP